MDQHKSGLRRTNGRLSSNNGTGRFRYGIQDLGDPRLTIIRSRGSDNLAEGERTIKQKENEQLTEGERTVAGERGKNNEL